MKISMIIFFGLTTLINLAIAALTYTPSMRGWAAGGFDKLHGLEAVGWAVVLALPVIAVAGAVLPWLFRKSPTIALFLALLPAAILGTLLYAAQAGLVS